MNPAQSIATQQQLINHYQWQYHSEPLQLNDLHLSVLTQQSLWCVKLRCQQQSFALYFSDESLQQFATALRDPLPFQRLPSALLEALFETWLAPLQKSYFALFGDYFAIESVDMTQAITLEHCLVFDVHLHASFHVYLDVKDVDLAHLAAVLNLKEKPPAPELLCHCQLVLGTGVLTLEEQQQLAIGDVLFFDACYYQQQQLRLDIQHQERWLVDIKDEPSLDAAAPQQTLTIVQAWPTSVANKPAFAVSLDFCLMAQNRTFGELNQYTTGSVFEFSQPPDVKIDIRHNQASVAKGELVKIGETLGVRILKMMGANIAC